MIALCRVNVDALNQSRGSFSVSTTQHDIPLFRCLADADSGICAALAFGNGGRRMSPLPGAHSETVKGNDL